MLSTPLVATTTTGFTPSPPHTHTSWASSFRILYLACLIGAPCKDDIFVTAKAKYLSEAHVVRKVRVFVDVTDLYGQIYVERDIASRMNTVVGVNGGLDPR